MEEDVSEFVHDLFRLNAIERSSEAAEFIAARNDPKTLILDAIDEFGLTMREVPAELRTKYVSKKQLEFSHAVETSPRKSSPKTKQERRAKSEARMKQKRGNSTRPRQLSRRELKEATARNTQANQQIASLYQRDSTRKKRKSRMVKSNDSDTSTSPKKVIIEEKHEQSQKVLSRMPSDGLPKEFDKFMRNTSKKDDNAEVETRSKRGISFDLDDKKEVQKDAIAITKRTWSADEVMTRTRQVHQYDLLGFKVREIDGLLVVTRVNKAGCHFRGWLKPGDVVLSINDVQNMEPKAVHKMVGPMGATIKKVEGVFPGIENYDIESDNFVVQTETQNKSSEDAENEKEEETIENESDNVSEKESQSEEEPAVDENSSTKASDEIEKPTDTSKSETSDVSLLKISPDSKKVENDADNESIMSPFSSVSGCNENFFKKSSASDSKSSKKKKKKKKQRKRSKESNARQAQRLQKLKEHFANVRRQGEDLSDDILEAQVSQDIRNRILEVLKEKLENAKDSSEVAWKRMEDILELQIDEVLHGKKSELTTTTSRDLVYNAIKLIFKELNLPKDPPSTKRRDSATAESRASFLANEAVINELTLQISESQATIVTLESLGISTPEIEQRLLVERENLQNLTNQLLASLPTSKETQARLSAVKMRAAQQPPRQSLTHNQSVHRIPQDVAWDFSDNDLSRYTEDIPDDPEVMRQEIHRLRTQVRVQSPLPFAQTPPQLPVTSQKQTLRTIGKTLSSSSFSSKATVSTSHPASSLMMQPRLRSFSEDVNDPVTVEHFARLRGFSADLHLSDSALRMRQLNPEEMMSQPLVQQTHPRGSLSAQPFFRSFTGSSSSSDNFQDDLSRKSSIMAERAAAATLSSPRRTVVRVPSVTRAGGKTEKISAAKFLTQNSVAPANVLSSTVQNEEEFLDNRDISSATSPLHALAAERNFEIHE